LYNKEHRNYYLSGIDLANIDIFFKLQNKTNNGIFLEISLLKRSLNSIIRTWEL